MKFYHRTKEFMQIIERGFKNEELKYQASKRYYGVCLTDRPLEIKDGGDEFKLLVIEIPEDIITPFEWYDKTKPYREFIVPAELINSYERPRLYSAGDQQENK